MNQDHLKAAVAAFCLFGSIVLYVFEFPHYHNMFGIKSFLITAALVGLIIGLAVSNRLSRGVKDDYDRMRIHVGITILMIVLMPLFMSWLNRFLVFRGPQQEQVEFVQQDGYNASRFGDYVGKNTEADGVYTYIIRKGELKRLKSKGPIFPTAQKGDKVLINVLKGALGWEVVITN